MIKRVSTAFYELKPKWLGGVRRGALLRVLFEDGVLGFCDCHPWPELGDLPLEEQLKSLKIGKKTPLLERSLHFARIDGVARAEKRSLFEGVTIPPSHRLISIDESLDAYLKEGFSRFKLKLRGEDPRLKTLFKTEALFRLDFNNSLNESAFRKFLEGVDLKAIEFIEDPFPYDPIAWKKIEEEFGVALAHDRKDAPSFHSLIILKPAVESYTASSKQKVVVTSYLDHPIGQLFASFEASQIANLQCGLISHLSYEINPFSAELKTQGPNLIPPKGYGIGFDRLLQSLNWQSF